MNSIREDLKAFVDGELSPERMQEIQTAIDADPALQQEVAFLRTMGEEIRQIAAEPEVAGKEALVSKFRRAPLPWWDAARLSGRLAYAAGLFCVLAGVSAILFPVFAQSKESAKTTSAMSQARMKALSDQIAGESTSGFAPESDAEVAEDRNAAEIQGPEDSGSAGGAKMPSPGEEVGPQAFASKTLPEMERPVDRGAGTWSGEAKSVPNTARRQTPGSSSANRPTNRDDNAPPQAEAPVSNRMVVKNANIDLKVESVEKAMADAENLAKSLGGYTEGSNLQKSEGAVPSGFTTLRVPTGSYESAMQALRKFGEVLGQNSNAVDVTAAHADVQARLKVLRAEEESYVTMLRAARKVGEIMEIKDRLSQIRQQIESYDAQRKSLINEAALSTIRASFTEKAKLEEKPKEKDGGFDETWAKAQNGLSAVGEFLGNFAIYVFVFSPVWLPPVILFWWLGRRARG